MTTTDEATPTTLTLDERAVAAFGDQILGSYTGAYRPELTDVMDGLRSPMFDGVVPLVAGLAERLAAGVRVADIGCGTGHTTKLLASAFPNSTFVGYDLADDAIARGTAEAAGYGLSNATSEVADATRLSADPPLDVAVAFDAIHDRAGVLARIFDALLPGGVFVMFDIRPSSHLERDLDNPMAPWLDAASTLHCVPVSLVEGGAGLGTVRGEEVALQMLTDAGFVGLEVHQVARNPLDSVYVAHKPG